MWRKRKTQQPQQSLQSQHASQGRTSETNSTGCRTSVVVWMLLLSNILVFQLSDHRQYYHHWNTDGDSAARTQPSTTNKAPLLVSPLDIPQGPAVPLPSIPVQDSQVIKRDMYGGVGDKVHLGGFTEFDLEGISPTVWKWMVQYVGVKSLLDVGCGRGISTAWFVLHGVDAHCVEGSRDAYDKSIVPSKETRVVQHDFTRGPWWPTDTVDAVWCVEFLEHVGRNHFANYVASFRKAAVIFVTSSFWGGWHHVEVHDNDWWIDKMELFGFRYSGRLSAAARKLARVEKGKYEMAPNGKPYDAQHIALSMKVFINPSVAVLPQHAHILAEDGCFKDFKQKGNEFIITNKPCGTGKGADKETPLPDRFRPIELTPAMDTEWTQLVRKNVKFQFG